MELMLKGTLRNTVDVTGKGHQNCSECPCDSEHSDNGAYPCVLCE